MQDIVGANCGCGSDANASRTVDCTDGLGLTDREEDRCGNCGEPLIEVTFYAGAVVTVCPSRI